MFTIQYQTPNGEHRMQEFDSDSRQKLIKHLARFERPIVAVYEQVTVVTKPIRALMAQLPLGSLSNAARDFVNSRP